MSFQKKLADRLVSGVLDLTTTELADDLVGGVLSAGPDRLTTREYYDLVAATVGVERPDYLSLPADIYVETFPERAPFAQHRTYSIEKLAADVSDAPSKANGGLIGPIPKTELDEELAKMIGAMKVGEVTRVVRVQGGFEILKLESTIESTTLPFEQARNQIANRLPAMIRLMTKMRSSAPFFC